MRSSWLLFTLLVLVALSAAFKVEDALHVDGINAYLHHGVRRQADGTGVASSEPTRSSSPPPETSSADEPSPTPDPEPSPSSSPAPSPSSDDSSSEDASPSPTPAPSPSSASPSATQTSASITRDNAQSSSSATPQPSQSVTTKPLVSTEVVPTTTIIEFVTNGSTMRSTSVGSRTTEHTTGYATETALSNSNGSGGGSDGLSSEKKAIIGGVIGGVGGAILLGGIAIVCWRMWGKKKRVSEDDADLMAGTGAALGDKSSTASPFHSNLEQYHNPGGRPNAAANF